MNPETKICQNCKRDFVIASEDFDFYKKIQVPPPTFCPDCRLQRRLAFRNERSLYKRTCDLCKKQFVSMYSPPPASASSGASDSPDSLRDSKRAGWRAGDKLFTVYCKECWYSDNWDPLQYGREYDWKRPFFAQFRELMHKVPRIGIMHIHTNVGADYANYIADVKNVYLSHSIIAGSENVYYSRNIDSSKEIFDCFTVKDSEQCYENVDGARNYRLKFVVRSRDCIDSLFLFDCVNCQNCFMSVNLRNRRYVIRDVQYTKEEYVARLKEEHIGAYSNLRARREEFVKMMSRALHRYGNLTKTVHCTGDNIDNSKSTKYSFDVYESENSKYCVRVAREADCHDVVGAADAELAYDMLAGGYNSRNSQFTDHSEATIESQYTNWCQNSKNLFGCAGLRKKECCILNMQYSKEEYEKLRMRIIAHMNVLPYADKKGRVYKYGEFFPVEFSAFAYNETIAEEYFPLQKEEAIARGFAWRDPDPSPYAPTLRSEELPENIGEAKDSVVNAIIGCTCGRVYRIVKPELEFLRREGIALPRKCQECRHKARFALRNPLRLWHRRCMCNQGTSDKEQATSEHRNTAPHFHGEEPCPNEFETSYAPERQETVYCEQCYQAEVA